VVLRGIFGPEGQYVTRRWRILYNEAFHNLYYSGNIREIKLEDD
jgi:hypothetical protein